MERSCLYFILMHGFFFAALLLAMFLTLAILVTGMVAMSRGGEFNRKYGNKLMQARVIMQGIAIALFAMTILTQAS